MRRYGLTRLVVDPVMVAKSGDRLLREDAVAALRAELLPLALVVTPNIPEAETLAGMAIATEEDRREAARRIAAFGPRNVVVKGGHVAGDPVDLLYDGSSFVAIESGPRIDTPNTHGTGCTFASSIAAHLALGRSLAEAVQAATDYVAGAIAHATAIRHGHGPVEHFWRGWHGRNVILP
jgi:hydroxymethylpyrimidine/phosphomethylpyrimidine kinase